MSIRVTPLDASFGATVTDVDLRQLNDEDWSAIYAAFLEYAVLVFPDQHLDEAAQDAFALRFGPCERLFPQQTGPSFPISNVNEDGSLVRPGAYHYQLLKGNDGWHTDSTYMPVASKAAMLTALELPPDGGETEFADMRAAWDALSADEQHKLASLSAFHSNYYSQEKAGFKHTTDNLYGFHDKGAPLRPLVKTHPETGRKSIYTGRHAYGIPGMDAAESEQLLADLMSRACQPPRIYTHTWHVGETVVWDNLCLMHRSRPYDPNHARVLRGTRISGDPATELAPTFADERADAFHPSTSNESPEMGRAS
ncbi:MAG: TauD/TfdA dioxygenase family protein [Gammaproteobacteria bacterium]